MSLPDHASISVIVPVFNEQPGIEHLAERLGVVRRFWADRALQFVVVDDGSEDETSAALQRAFGTNSDFLILTHDCNRGIGAAFRTGFARARGDIICTIDADCSYGPEKLHLLVDELEASAADIAIASPYHPDAAVENVPAWRLALSRGCSLLYRWISPVRLYTYTSVFRAYRRDVVERVRFEEDGFVSAVELLIRAAEQNFRITEVPMTLRARKFGTSKMKVLRTIQRHMLMMLRCTTRRYRAAGSVAQ